MADQPTLDRPLRWVIFAAGIAGAVGVAMAAAAAHAEEARLLGAASAICLANAPALLALGLAGGRLRLGALSAALLILGTVLFAGDLGLRVVAGQRLFPMAAPIGGSVMIAGWLLIALAALLPSRRS